MTFCSPGDRLLFASFVFVSDVPTLGQILFFILFLINLPHVIFIINFPHVIFKHAQCLNPMLWNGQSWGSC